MLDVRRLRVLIEVADRRSFQAAAEALSFTQPSVSRHVAALEREVGCPLLDRTRGKIRLTQAGEIAVEHAKVVLARLARAEVQLAALQGAEGGRLRLAAFASANAWLVPTALQVFAQRHPDVDLSLTSGSSLEHRTRLLAGEIDVALITDWDHPDRARREGIELVPLLDDILLLALPRSHRFAQDRAPIALQELAGETWIEGPHPDCLGPLGELHGAFTFHPEIKFICEDLVGKQALVAAEMGITLLPGLCISSVQDNIVLRAIAGDFPTRRVYAAYCLDGYRVPAVDEMVDVLHTVAMSHQSHRASSCP